MNPASAADHSAVNASSPVVRAMRRTIPELGGDAETTSQTTQVLHPLSKERQGKEKQETTVRNPF